MARVRLAAGAVLVLLLLSTLGVPAAHGQTDRKPRDNISLRVNHRVVHSGERIVVRARSRLTCGWIVTGKPQRREMVRKQKLGRILVLRFKTPIVTEPTKLRVRATCLGMKGGYGDPNRGRAPMSGVPTSSGTPSAVDPQTISAVVPGRWKKRITLRLLPRRAVGDNTAGAGDGPHHGGLGPGVLGSLPDTGGPALWLLLLGLIGTVVGVTLTVRRPHLPRGRPA